MFGKNKSEKKIIVIGFNSSVTGKIKKCDEVRINGTFKGEINIDGDVYIHKDSVAKAIISASTVYISGKAFGIINVTKKMLLTDNGVYIYNPEILKDNKEVNINNYFKKKHLIKKIYLNKNRYILKKRKPKDYKNNTNNKDIHDAMIAKMKVHPYLQMGFKNKQS